MEGTVPARRSVLLGSTYSSFFLWFPLTLFSRRLCQQNLKKNPQTIFPFISSLYSMPCTSLPQCILSGSSIPWHYLPSTPSSFPQHWNKCPHNPWRRHHSTNPDVRSGVLQAPKIELTALVRGRKWLRGREEFGEATRTKIHSMTISRWPLITWWTRIGRVIFSS